MRPRFSRWLRRAALVAVLLVARRCCWTGPANRTAQDVVTVRLWAEQVAAAYRESFDEFTRSHPDIEVRINMVAYSTYFDTLRTDVAGGSADDIFWLSNAYLAGYADSGRLMDIGKTLGPNAAGVGAGGGRPVHPRRCALGGAAADRRRHRACTTTPTCWLPRASTPLS